MIMKTWFSKIFGFKSIKAFFAFHKGETSGNAFAAAALLGLLLQIIAIIVSFLLPKTPFEPILAPLLLILLSIAGLTGYRGYGAVLLGTLVFFTSFKGGNILAHPAFYHCLGLVLYAVEWTAIRHLHPKQRKEEKRYSETHRYVIVHRQASDISIQRIINGTQSTWLEKKTPFAWTVARPREGKETFTMECPVCKKQLKIEEVYASALLVKYRAIAKKLMRVSDMLFFNALLSFIPFFFPHPAWLIALAGPLGGLASGVLLPFISFAVYHSNLNAPDAKKGIPAGIEAQYVKAPYTTHYFDSISGE